MAKGSLNHPSAALARAVEDYQAGKFEDAMKTAQRLGTLHPNDPGVNHFLGWLLLVDGQAEAAMYRLEKAAASAPAGAAGAVHHITLGMALSRVGRHDRAAEMIHEGLRRDPLYWAGHLELGNAMIAARRPAEAERHYRHAMKLAPREAVALANLGVALVEQGRADEAVEALLKNAGELALNPVVLSRACGAMNYVEGMDLGAVLAAHKKYGEVIGAWAQRVRARMDGSWGAPEGSAEKVLRVGYVSTDLRTHSTTMFLEPLLEHHDRGAFEVFCYDTTGRRDGVTKRLKTYPATWRTIVRRNDSVFAQQVRRDRIDVLVDLSGHMEGHSLGMFSLGAAPVQLTMIGYPNTTGVPAVGARVVDWETDPAGADAWTTEELMRLDGCFLCYRPPRELAGEIDRAATEANATGRIGIRSDGTARAGSDSVRFCCFNAMPKISDATVEAWARILARVDGSTLYIKNAAMGEDATRDRLLAKLQARGVERGRVQTATYSPTMAGHLAEYRGCDIALDTLGYNGTTTTCEALWMGVPVVAMRGDRHAARVSASLLRAAGLDELVAGKVDEYIELAVELARDSARREKLAEGLRARVEGSALCDGRAYTRRVEAMMRELWTRRLAAASE